VPPAALAARGRVRSERLERLALLSAGMEIAYDKLPWAPSRLDPVGIVARVVSSGMSGAVLARGRGAVAGAGGAMAGAFAGYHARRALGRATGWDDPPIGFGEDLLSLAVAWLAVR
jgi:uncharacterized membrane protein